MAPKTRQLPRQSCNVKVKGESMDRVEELVVIEENGEGGEDSKKQDEVKLAFVDTVKNVVAKLEDVSTRLIKLENYRIKADHTTVTGTFLVDPL